MTVVPSRFATVKNDLYETEYWATAALDRHFPVRGRTVWEPAAGNRKIADILIMCGADVWASDIQEYTRPLDFLFDFTQHSEDIPQVDAIITNPPFGKQNRLAAEFVRLALRRAPFVAMLLTAKFDFGSTRNDLFRDSKRFAAKIVLTDRIQWFPGDQIGTEDHAWYVWTEYASGPPRIIYDGKKPVPNTDLFAP